MAKNAVEKAQYQRFTRTDWSREVPADIDGTRNPSGIYSGMAKRVCIEDGTFSDIGNLPRGGPGDPIHERRRK